MITFLSLEIELGILWIIDQGDFWINKMLKFLLFYKIVLIKSFFFQIFCENTFRVFKFIVLSYPQLS